MAVTDDDPFERLLRGVAKTPDVTGVRRVLRPGVRLRGRFEIRRQLGRGGMGRVFAAHDELRDEEVALKVLGTLTPESIRQLKREFRSASDLLHPNLVELHELFADDSEWFLTMELVEGHHLHALPDARDAQVLRGVFGQLALALHALHGVGTLHGDLTPSNFLICGAQQRVALLDFGISRSLREAHATLSQAGTPGYMSPEQEAGQQLSEASDWFAFGVVLREALLRTEQSDEALELLCAALLRRDPSARPSGDAVLRALGVAPDSARISGSHPSFGAFVVGRDDELARLTAAYAAAAAGKPTLCLVHGPSGIGKTTLVQELVQRARSNGALVLAGRCRERESVGHKAIDVLIDDLLELFERMPIADVQALLPDGIIDLCRLFPALRSAEAVAQACARRTGTPDQSLARQHAIVALRELFSSLSEQRSLLLWIDDLQWSDRESAELLAALLGGATPLRLLFIGSYRVVAEGRGAALDALFAKAPELLRDALDVPLQALSASSAEQLARGCLPVDHPRRNAMAAQIAREAEGNPLFVAELARSGALPTSDDERLPSSLAQLVSERVSALPEPARQLLSQAAVAGAPLTRATMRRCSSSAPASFERALSVLRMSRLVRTTGVDEESECDIVHDRIREIVLSTLDEPGRSALHLSVAQALERERSAPPALIAGHYRSSGQPAKAAPFWVLAADQAAQSLAFARAAQLYAQALADARDMTRAQLDALRVRRAEALALDGSGVLAADVYLEVATYAEPDRALELRRRAAEQLLLSGHLERGLKVIRLVLDAIGLRDTRAGRRALLSIAFGRARIRARGLSFHQRLESAIDPLEIARVDASWTVAISLGVVDFMRGADFQNEHLLLALRAGEPLRLLRALIVEVSYCAAPGVGSERRTEELLALVDKLSAQLMNPGAIALAQVSRGIAAYLQGQNEASARCCEQALATLRTHSSGAVWETVTAQRFLVAALFQLGKLRQLHELVPPLLAEAERQGNLYASVAFRTTYSNLVWLMDDRVEDARSHLARARSEWTLSGFQLPHSWMLVGETYLRFYTQDYEAAWQGIEASWPGLVEHQLLRIGAIRVQAWHLRAASALAAFHVAKRAGRQRKARVLLREARHATEQLGEQRAPMARPLHLVLQAALACASESHGATALLERSVREFSALNMPLFAAASRARLMQLRGDPDALVCPELEAEGVKVPARMLNVLAPGFP